MASPFLFCLLSCVIAAAAEHKNTRRPTENGYQYWEFESGVEILKNCPFALGEQLKFDNSTGRCTMTSTTKQRPKRQWSVIGYPCFESTDCTINGPGMYCSADKKCGCLSTFVEVDGYCWPKIDPDKSGCSNSRQCSAVFPGAYCSSGTCKCGNGQPAVNKREGALCFNPGQCPTNGEAPKFKSSGQIESGCGLSMGDLSCPQGYDCFCSTTSCGLDDDPLAYSYCCPSRSFTCIQPASSGSMPMNGAGYMQRWYYNSISGNCEPFQYYGSGGNANNFETKDFCESYCKSSCGRGAPQYNADQTGVQYCSGTTSCNSNYGCTSIGTQSRCCPTSSYICSANGGFAYGGTPFQAFNVATQLYDPGWGIRSASDTSSAVQRFYYDASTKMCQIFTYLGQAGNFNNFLTRDQCQTYCATVVCDAGSPLTDANGLTLVTCSGGSDCPSSHDCTSKNVCCPKKQTVCSLPKVQGNCVTGVPSYVDRWWFNAATGNCEVFTFSGCQGNANNFGSMSSCQTFCASTAVEPKCLQGKAAKDSSGIYIICGGAGMTGSCTDSGTECYSDGKTYGCCPTVATTCASTYSSGTRCGPSVNRWYYDSSTRTCKTFEYYGCDGNSNNFATQHDCQDYCGVGGCPEGGEPYRETTSGAYRVCSTASICPYTHYCTQVTFGTTTTYNYCCPTRTYVCSIPVETGARCLSSPLTRYFFNSNTKVCESFAYNGCGGNRNNYPSTAACYNYCNSAGCVAGTVAETVSSGAVTSCNFGQQSSCASTSVCSFSSLLQKNICCGAPGSTERCPATMRVYIDSFTLKPKQCTPNVDGSCPAGYICWYQVSQAGYFCCGSGINQCPLGGSVYLNPSIGVAQECTPGITSSCPAGYTCQATTAVISGIQSTRGFCCGSPGMCPNNGQAQLNNGSPLTCTSDASCGSPYKCTYSTSLLQSFCCWSITPITPNVCGNNSPFMLNGAPVVCSPNSVYTNCPSPYQCTLYPQTNNYYCCQSGPVTPVATTVAPTPAPTAYNCPPGLQLQVAGGQPQFCSPNVANSCAVAAYCQYDAVNLRYVCCAKATPATGQCPNSVSSNQQCSSASNTCNIGTYCANLAQGQYCCPITAKCSNGQTATQTCTGSSCPTGQTCVTLEGLNYCCPATPTPPSTFVCPGNSLAFINPFSNQPQMCVPNFVMCPTGYGCKLGATGNLYYCCQETPPTQKPTVAPTVPPTTNICNSGTPLISIGSTAPQTCNPVVGPNCPSTYACQFSLTLFRYICCQDSSQPAGDQYGCPKGETYLYPGTTLPLSCTSNCPSGYECLKSTKNSGSQCCKSASTPKEQTPATPVSIKLGESGCVRDTQCQGNGQMFGRCASGKCLCSSNLLVYGSNCVYNCPWPYYNTGGVCSYTRRFKLNDDHLKNRNCSLPNSCTTPKTN